LLIGCRRDQLLDLVARQADYVSCVLSAHLRPLIGRRKRARVAASIGAGRMPVSVAGVGGTAVSTVAAVTVATCESRQIARQQVVGERPEHCPVDVAVAIVPERSTIAAVPESPAIDVSIGIRPEHRTGPAAAEATEEGIAGPVEPVKAITIAEPAKAVAVAEPVKVGMVEPVTPSWIAAGEAVPREAVSPSQAPGDQVAVPQIAIRQISVAEVAVL